MDPPARIEHGSKNSGVFEIRLAGPLDVLDADRLAFLVQTEAPSEFEVDLAGVESASSSAVASMVDHVRVWLEQKRRVRMFGLPQHLAHTLYKLGYCKTAPSLIGSVQAEEPYAG